MKPYDHENDLSFPAELERINLKNLLKTGGFKMNSSTNYSIDLSGMKWKEFYTYKNSPFPWKSRNADIAHIFNIVSRSII